MWPNFDVGQQCCLVLLELLDQVLLFAICRQIGQVSYCDISRKRVRLDTSRTTSRYGGYCVHAQTFRGRLVCIVANGLKLHRLCVCVVSILGKRR